MSDRYSTEEEAKRLSKERNGGEKPRIRRTPRSGGESEALGQDSGQDQQNDEGVTSRAACTGAASIRATSWAR